MLPGKRMEIMYTSVYQMLTEVMVILEKKVLAVVMKADGALYKLGTQHVFKQLIQI